MFNVEYFQEIVLVVTSRSARADFKEVMSKEFGPVTMAAPTSQNLSALDLAEAEEENEEEECEETSTEMSKVFNTFFVVHSMLCWK